MRKNVKKRLHFTVTFTEQSRKPTVQTKISSSMPSEIATWQKKMYEIMSKTYLDSDGFGTANCLETWSFGAGGYSHE